MHALTKVLVISIAFGIVLNLPFVSYDIYRDLFRADVYERLHIGMSEATAIEILGERKVRCELFDVRSSTCHFSDFWRDYYISVDPSTAMITERSYRNRNHHSILRMVIR